MNDKEIIKKLAESIIFHYKNIINNDICVFCGMLQKHADDCPMLIAQEIVNNYEPERVHNVLKYQNKYYLKRLSPCCSECAFYDNKSFECIKHTNNKENIKTKFSCNHYIWKAFDTIEITDTLACERKYIGRIFLTTNTGDIITLVGVGAGGDIIFSGYYQYHKSLVRLSTLEEIKSSGLLN